jgi:hypothetical protein
MVSFMKSTGNTSHVLLLALIVTACAVPGTEVAGDVAVQGSTTVDVITTGAKTTESAKVGLNEPNSDKESDCPVTIPPDPGFVATEPEKAGYSEHFPAPEPFPNEYPHEGMVWYGTDELWTVLSVDGDHAPRKSVWWSSNFPGGIMEGEPEVWVTWTRLDTDRPVVIDNDGNATNAYIPEEGWFMIAGIDPPQPGCWQVEATYKGASLTYVYRTTE